LIVFFSAVVIISCLIHVSLSVNCLCCHCRQSVLDVSSQRCVFCITSTCQPPQVCICFFHCVSTCCILLET